MRVGLGLPYMRPDGTCPTAAELMHRARVTEEAGFDAIWIHDNIGRGPTRPDTLAWVLIAGAATTQIEVGTSVLQVPLRRPVELAQRLLTLHGLTNGRFVAGLGAGSTQADFDAVGVEYEARFRLFHEYLQTMKALFRGERVGDADLKPWPNTLGGPPILIGAWSSDLWIKRAARDYDGWMTSGGAGGGSVGRLKEGIKRFRDLGGKRAIVASVGLDLKAPTEQLTDESRFSLQCDPAEARRRIQFLADLGYDDVQLGGESYSDEEVLEAGEQLGLKRRAPA